MQLTRIRGARQIHRACYLSANSAASASQLHRRHPAQQPRGTQAAAGPPMLTEQQSGPATGKLSSELAATSLARHMLPLLPSLPMRPCLISTLSMQSWHHSTSPSRLLQQETRPLAHAAPRQAALAGRMPMLSPQGVQQHPACAKACAPAELRLACHGGAEVLCH